MEKSKLNADTIGTLNDLIKINHDRIKGYEKAIKNTDSTDADLITLYSRMIDESYQYNRELSEVVTRLGGEPASDTTIPGKIYHAWMDVKATFSGNDTKSILSACEYGEDAAQKAYSDALDISTALTTEANELLIRQKSLLKGSHDLVRQFRDQYAEA
jgi:uncharacterized protein (TIGR02284 family)